MTRIAIPIADGALCAHFGHAPLFALVDLATDSPDGRPYTVREVTPPPHEPGSLPRWLQAEGVTTVIAGGLGGKALQMLEQQGMRVISGAPILPLDTLLEQALDGSLPMGVTLCPQGDDHSCSSHEHGKH